jgi:hypothetical protein
VSCTTPQLADVIRPFNPNVYILPNAIDPAQPQWKVTQAVRSHKPTIGWVGGISHLEDIKLLSGQIKRICENIEDYNIDDIEWKTKYVSHDTIKMKMSA